MAIEQGLAADDPALGEASAITESCGPGKQSIRIPFGGLAVTASACGAVYIEAYRTLIVSDLHLEKGSAAAARGRPIPGLDTRETLLRLKASIETFQPECVICLGDSFHDNGAGERMAMSDRERLAALREEVREWIWIGGNHDPELPHFCPGAVRGAIEVGGIVLSHEPQSIRTTPQIAGHLHPKASIQAGGHRFSGRCFCIFEDLLILPAFGAYAGGLSCADRAIKALGASAPKILMLHASRIWRVA
jgi:uncharacterized protein